MIKHHDIVQGSDEWIAARCGKLCASQMKHLFTPVTMKEASNDKARWHFFEILAQRISGYVEPSFISEDMLRGYNDEDVAIEHYSRAYAPVIKMGFITNNKWGFTLGYSPDGLVGDDGLIEVKSRRQGLHVRAIIEHMADGNVPPENLLQVQTGLLVSGRDWCDVISYSGGLPMTVVRAFVMPDVQAAILKAAATFEARLAEGLAQYREFMAEARAIPTERVIYQDIAA